ncbi:MAG: LLM class F420-dependent oxidoreductase [Dehalococcoidia bacterium]|nr:LLM class F420-dependent oxidoreductase [Dehalococcoidia bacterium]
MQLGIVFPQHEMPADPVAMRDFAQAAEGLGFSHMLIYDHVLGADPERPGGWNGPYDKDTPFQEPFVTLGYLAGQTSTIEFCTSVLVLPQRQTALVAKQAAQVQILSGGRMRLGIGVGWNDVEYEALGMNFHDRGKRQEEQVELMRELWAKDVVDFHGRWHSVPRASINPRPQNPIPVWFGGSAPQLADRIARLGDGWVPLMGPSDQAAEFIDRLRGQLEANGRDAASVGIQAQAQARGGNAERWAKHAQRWRDLGATHLAIATMDAGFASPGEHIEAARQWKEAVEGI